MKVSESPPGSNGLELTPSVQYLFAAIDARQQQRRESVRNGHQNGRPARQRFPPDELKRLVVEASEAVDDKSAANEFQETLERIVNEIKNTTEHSGAFLQKVRKSDVPDYYDVIKRPMDLGTLLKKVKQQAYRTKRAFAEDLDLIWSNCLLYNSHPAHPLRASAEALRAKSNQLLEFITDPSVTQRTLLVASMSSAALENRRAGSTRIGTPDDDGDADGESDDERRSKRALSERLLNGVNGDHRDSSASPAPSRSQTPALSRRLSRKFSQGPLGRISASPEPSEAAPTSLPFEERPAFVRTPQGMQSFLLLDAELAKLEGRLGFTPSRTSSSAVLPSSFFGPSASSSTSAPASKKGKPRLVSHIRSLNPSLLPSPSQPTLTQILETNGTPADDSTSSSAAATPAALPLPPPPQPAKRDPNEPLEAVWWDVVASSSSSSALFPPPPASSTAAAVNGINGAAGHEEEGRKDITTVPAMVAGMPRVPWVGYRATPYETAARSGVKEKGKRKKGSQKKGKGKAVDVEVGMDVDGEEVDGAVKKGKAKKRKETAEAAGEEKGLAPRMRKNCETLRRIRNIGERLARESTTSGELDPPEYLTSEDDSDFDPDLPNGIAEGDAMDVDSAPPPPKKRRRGHPSRIVAVSTTVPAKAFRCSATAPTAAKEAMRAAAGGVLGHAGFEGASAGALDVLAHLASEYMVNLGRTLRFYSDRYAAELTPQQMLTQTLSENGIPSPSALDSYVAEDIDRYGSRLSELLRKLERAREEQLDSALSSSSAAADGHAAEGVDLDEGDEHAFVTGEFAGKIGEDFFGLAELLGVETGGETAGASLVPPTWLIKGESRLESVETSGDATPLTYSPPPSHIPLFPSSIPSQIGLLQPYYSLRLSQPSLGLADDLTLTLSSSSFSSLTPAARPKSGTRHKVPANGRIGPFKGRKRPEDPTLPAAMAAALQASLGEPVKKKKKKPKADEGESGAE
ncbi:hypothetical protein JCM8547_000959 [Rhodosporidiobolus lusitaniae]